MHQISKIASSVFVFCVLSFILKAQNTYFNAGVTLNQIGTGDLKGVGASIGIEKKIKNYLSVDLQIEQFAVSREYLAKNTNIKLPLIRIGNQYTGLKLGTNFNVSLFKYFNLGLKPGLFYFKTQVFNPKQLGFDVIVFKNGDVETFVSLNGNQSFKNTFGGFLNPNLSFKINKKISLTSGISVGFDLKKEVYLSSPFILKIAL